MPNFINIQQFFDTITARLTKPKRGVGGSEGVVATDVLEALKDVARYADDVQVSSAALTAGFVARSLNLNETIYVRGDTGSDTRTGEVDAATGNTGAVKTLARVIALHSGKTQKLRIDITSGVVELTADLALDIPEVIIYVAAGATLRFRKKTALKDGANVTVGEGNYRLQCISNTLNIRVDGLLDVEAHSGSTGTGDQFYYKAGQGAMSIVSNSAMVYTIVVQTITLFTNGTVTVGNNTTLFAYGNQGTNNYGSERARYKKFVFAGSLTLGTNATESALQTDKLLETLVFEGNGSAKSFNIRRTYPFSYVLVYNDGCTISVEPGANCSANANNTLTFTGAVGKTVTVRLTSNI